MKDARLLGGPFTAHVKKDLLLLLLLSSAVDFAIVAFATGGGNFAQGGYKLHNFSIDRYVTKSAINWRVLSIKYVL